MQSRSPIRHPMSPALHPKSARPGPASATARQSPGTVRPNPATVPPNPSPAHPVPAAPRPVSAPFPPSPATSRSTPAPRHPIPASAHPKSAPFPPNPATHDPYRAHAPPMVRISVFPLFSLSVLPISPFPISTFNFPPYPFPSASLNCPHGTTDLSQSPQSQLPLILRITQLSPRHHGPVAKPPVSILNPQRLPSQHSTLNPQLSTFPPCPFPSASLNSQPRTKNEEQPPPSTLPKTYDPPQMELPD